MGKNMLTFWRKRKQSHLSVERFSSTRKHFDQCITLTRTPLNKKKNLQSLRTKMLRAMLRKLVGGKEEAQMRMFFNQRNITLTETQTKMRASKRLSSIRHTSSAKNSGRQ